MDLRAEGDLLVVRERARIPKICVKCGATKDVSRRDLPFAVGQAGTAAGAGGGIVGAMVAQTVRNAFRDDTVLQAIVIGVLFAVVIVIALVAHRSTRRIHLMVPLCGEHEAALDAALRHRTWILIALGAGGLAMLAGIAADSIAVIAFALLLFLGPVGAAYALGMPQAWVKARWARGDLVALDVGADLAKKMVARHEKRLAKRDAVADDDEPAPDAA